MVADHILEFHTAEFTARTFVILFRSEDSLAKESVAFRLIGTVVDRFGLFDFAFGLFANLIWIGETDLDCVKIVDLVVSVAIMSHVILV